MVLKIKELCPKWQFINLKKKLIIKEKNSKGGKLFTSYQNDMFYFPFEELVKVS